MNDKITKVPQIRFSGFTDDWEQRKLGDHAEVLTGGTPKTSILEYWNPKEIPWMSSGEINKRRLDETDNMISKEGLNNSSARWVKEYSVLIALAGQGKTRGTVAINNIPLTTNQSIAAIVPDETLHYEFIFQNLIKRYDELRMISSGDGTRGGLNKQIVSDVVIPYTSFEEQEKIGTFFVNLDDLITLQQRQLDLLKEMKKSLLQKMFPKDGANIPDIRFAGFTDDWEQRKLKNVANYIRGSFPQPYTNSNFYDEENGNPFVQVADIGFDLKLNPNTKAHISKIAEPKSRFVEAGKVVVALQGSIEKSIGRTAITQYDAYFDRTILIFEDYKVPMNKLYFAQVIKKLFEREKERAWGATISTITKKHLNDFVIGVPKIEEQKQIGSFFAHLDHLITLHQRQLDLLKEMKKSLLHHMFI